MTSAAPPSSSGFSYSSSFSSLGSLTPQQQQPQRTPSTSSLRRNHKTNMYGGSSSNSGSGYYHHNHSNYPQHHQQHHQHQHQQQSASAFSTTTNLAWTLKCTDVPQFDALQAQADLFRSDDKLHLRNLCNDSARCAGLVAIHHSKSRPSRTKMILDYSRQRVVGETMELLYDLADAVGLTDRRESMKRGHRINLTEDTAVLHPLLRQPHATDHEDVDMDDHNDNDDDNNNLDDGIFRLPPEPQPPQPAADDTRDKNSEESSSAPPAPPPAPPTWTPPLPPHPHDVFAVRRHVRHWCHAIRTGRCRGLTEERFRNTLVVAVGGVRAGVDCVLQALRHEPRARGHSQHRRLRCLDNVDPVQYVQVTNDWRAAETLVIVIDPHTGGNHPTANNGNGTTEPHNTMVNARTVLQSWLIPQLQLELSDATPAEIIARHVVVVTAHPERYPYSPPQSKLTTTTTTTNTGHNNIPTTTASAAQPIPWTRLIPPQRIIPLADWVNPRYSVWSAAGLLPLGIHFSWSVVQSLLQGAHDMDDHFMQAPLRDNLPVILGLLGVWNSTFLGYSARVLLPYAHALSQFPEYVQHVDMESNGKRVALDGTPLLHQSGEITLGAPGTRAQDCFFQLLHQGRVIPADFIGFMESQTPLDVAGETVSNHDELMTNFFAQPDALAYGKTLQDLVQEGTPDVLREHMVIRGNRPSSSLLVTRLDAFSVGQLMALYEHRTAVQGFLWGLNSFDHFGTELGGSLSKQVRAQLSASRKTGASVQGFNSSTSSLLEHYLVHGKNENK